MSGVIVTISVTRSPSTTYFLGDPMGVYALRSHGELSSLALAAGRRSQRRPVVMRGGETPQDRREGGRAGRH